MTRDNPILETVINRIAAGRFFSYVQPNGLDRQGDERSLLFHYVDGTEESVSFTCDVETFMDWFMAARRFVLACAEMAEAFGTPGDE